MTLAHVCLLYIVIASKVFGFMGNITIRYSTYDFLFNFHRYYVVILYHFLNIASYLLKVADLHLAPSCGKPRWNFAKTFDIKKLESLGYRVVWCC